MTLRVKGDAWHVLSVDYFSAALMRTTTLDVILPIDNAGEAMGVDHTRRHDPSAWDRRDYPSKKPPFKTLYLLHGITGNHTDLISETRIRALAEERNLAVVMPSGYNAFYLDHPETHNYYGRFVGEELLDVTRQMFPLSDRREDTFIGGVSMGAYGALRNGLKYCENFGSIIALSSAMVIDGFEQIISDGLFFLEPHRTSSPPLATSRQGRQLRQGPPRASPPTSSTATARARGSLWRAATDDPLTPANRVLADRMRGTGLDVTYHELQGGHDWNLWNQALPMAMDWLPR